MALPKLGSPKYYLTMPTSKKEVEYRPYSVKEEKALMIAVESKDQKQMIAVTRDLIEACTFGEVKAMDLPLIDFEYMFLMLRSKSVGETADLKIKCTECGESTNVSINIEDIGVKGELKEQIKIQLSDGIGMLLTYPKVKGIDRQTKGGKNDNSEYAQTISMIASCIESIYDEDNVYPAADSTPKELEEFVESLSSSQFKLVLEEFKELPTLHKHVEFNCSGCGHHNELDLEGLQNFF